MGIFGSVWPISSTTNKILISTVSPKDRQKGNDSGWNFKIRLRKKKEIQSNNRQEQAIGKEQQRNKKFIGNWRANCGKEKWRKTRRGWSGWRRTREKKWVTTTDTDFYCWYWTNRCKNRPNYKCTSSSPFLSPSLSSPLCLRNPSPSWIPGFLVDHSVLQFWGKLWSIFYLCRENEPFFCWKWQWTQKRDQANPRYLTKTDVTFDHEFCTFVDGLNGGDPIKKQEPFQVISD